MSETVEIEVPIRECFPDYAGDREPNLPEKDEWEDSMAVQMTKDIKKSEFLRERAEEQLNEEEIERAERLLWIDEAEVYSCCVGHYLQKQDGAWTGFTTHPQHDKIKEIKQKELREGRPCTFCKDNRIKQLKEEIEEEIEISIEVVE